MRTVTITKTTTETIEIPDLFDLSIGVTDSGPGGAPAHREIVTVNGEQLCYGDELSPGALAALRLFRAEVYQKQLEKIGAAP